MASDRDTLLRMCSGGAPFEDPVSSAIVFELWQHLDESTRAHLLRVGRLACDLACHIGLSAREQAESRLAGLVHDIGKLWIPDEIVAKAAPLNLTEKWLMRSHPETGARWLEGAVSPEVLDAIRHHHERMDGRGYPDGIPAGELPTVSRLVAVADTYDAITSDRPYRLARSPGEACRELRSGLQLDPDLVEALIDLERRRLGVRAA